MKIKNILNRFDPCPFCGKTDFNITPKKFFVELLEEKGSACISVRCENCSLDMYDHSDAAEYTVRVDNLVAKWNTRQNKEK